MLLPKTQYLKVRSLIYTTSKGRRCETSSFISMAVSHIVRDLRLTTNQEYIQSKISFGMLYEDRSAFRHIVKAHSAAKLNETYLIAYGSLIRSTKYGTQGDNAYTPITWDSLVCRHVDSLINV